MTARCGSTRTATGDPCRTRVRRSGELCPHHRPRPDVDDRLRLHAYRCQAADGWGVPVDVTRLDDQYVLALYACADCGTYSAWVLDHAPHHRQETTG